MIDGTVSDKTVIDFTGRAILLDIEGTTSAVAYVYEVMFPFARQGLGAYLDAHWTHPSFASVRQQIATDANEPRLAEDRQALEAEINRLMDNDIKATGLKQLQGFDLGGWIREWRTSLALVRRRCPHAATLAAARARPAHLLLG